jgi:hypothetical protein
MSSVRGQISDGGSQGRGDGTLVLSDTVRFFPIVFFEIFLLFTIFVFIFGPWQWPVTNPVSLYAFLLINQLALFWGYVRAVRKQDPAPFRLPVRIDQMVWAGALLTVLLLIPTLKTDTGGDIDVIRAFTDPGAAYQDTRYAVSEAAPGIVSYIRVFFSPLLWPLLPLTLVYWNRLNKLTKWVAVLGIVGDAFIYLLIGTNKRLVDIILLLPWLFIIRYRSAPKVPNRRSALRFFCLLALGLALFLSYFGENIAGRGRGEAEMGVYLGNGAVLRSNEMGNGWLVNLIGPGYYLGVASLASYIGNGYYGLSLALQEPFVWTYGVGHSRMLTWLAEKAATGRDEIWDRTYSSRVESDYGWDRDVQWLSLYPWLAGDVTFYVVPVVMFLIGRLLALTWLDALGGNPFATALFSLNVIMISYVSANAQIFQFGETVFVFYLYLYLWARSRRAQRRVGEMRRTDFLLAHQ